jgi:hypothetical protein
VAIARSVESSSRLRAVVRWDRRAGTRLRRPPTPEARGYKRQHIYIQRPHPPRHCSVPALVCPCDCRCGRRRYRGLVGSGNSPRGSGTCWTPGALLDHGTTRPPTCVEPARDAGGIPRERTDLRRPRRQTPARCYTSHRASS